MGKRYTVSVKKEHWEAIHDAVRATGKTLAECVDLVMTGKAYLQTGGDAPLAEPAPLAKVVAPIKVKAIMRDGHLMVRIPGRVRIPVVRVSTK